MSVEDKVVKLHSGFCCVILALIDELDAQILCETKQQRKRGKKGREERREEKREGRGREGKVRREEKREGKGREREKGR